MLVFWKQRLVLLSVPKTGSSALEAALAASASMAVLDPPELKHAPIYRYNRFFRPMFERLGAERMDIIALVREPIDWLGSWYRYRQRDFLAGRPESTRGMDFDTYCRAYASGERPAFADVGSLAKFVEPRPNGVAVTHLFRYEAMDAVTAYLAERLERPVSLPRANVSPRAPITLSAETEALLRRHCAADFAVWESARTG
ncbi:gamma-glutamyl kinase [Citreimonas salinaria]|uniref:Gamma-glutamyl kinase n=1 Tax=Citreimonas salinaria TaxID=321339 RepID=A0A1H3KUU6_9RHOB|nr:gamma-glutamyl kinase [Citreimonas salinaria]SDY55977.1 hypothetical protein SAMN05444340_110127 [Citreimonas salinaria]